MSERLPPLLGNPGDTNSGWNLVQPVAEIDREGQEKQPSNEAQEGAVWHELKAQADEAYVKFGGSIYREGIPEHLNEEQREAVGTMLRAWDHAYGCYKHYLRTPIPTQWHLDTMAIASWEANLNDQEWNIGTLVEPERLLRHSSLLGEEQPDLSGDTFHLIAELIEDPEFEERGLLARYLIDKADTYARTTEDPKAGERREGVLQVLRDGAVAAIREGDTAVTREILACFRDQKRQDLARGALVHEELDETSRETMMVQYINTFGFVDAVDAVSARIAELEQEPDANDTLEALRGLYSTFQGDRVDEIMQTLSEVYASINFHEYALNTSELTSREVDIVENHVLDKCAKVLGKEKRDIRFLDIGAGTGRHTLELIRRGYVSTVAMDIEQKHVDKIKELNPQANVVQGNWYEMPFDSEKEMALESDQGYGAIEAFQILGRSIHHARTPSEMLKIFDELQRITVEGAHGIIDIGREVGEYGTNLVRFKRNLQEKGIDPMYAEVIFDGPDNEHRFNRMLMSDKQFRTYSALMGFDIVEVFEEDINGVKNAYYVIKKSVDYDPNRYYFASNEQISDEKFIEMMREIGMFDAGTNYDMYIDSWGMTVAQALYYGLDNDEVVRKNKAGDPPKVRVTIDEGKVFFHPDYVAM